MRLPASPAIKIGLLFAFASVCIHGLRGHRVVARHALGIKLDRRLLQADAFDVRCSSRGNQNVIESLGLRASLEPAR